MGIGYARIGADPVKQRRDKRRKDSKLIIQSGIKRVGYRDEYRLTDGVDLLKRAGIEVEKVD